MAGRSSTRHKREIQGLDPQGDTSPQYGEFNDFVAKRITPMNAGGVYPNRTLEDHDQDGKPSSPAGQGGGSGSGGSKPCD